MSRGGICDSRCQAFYTAMIEKEESMRMRWFVKNKQKLLEHLEKTKPAKKIELPPIRERERKEPSVDIIRLKPLPNWRPMEPDGSININIMKPIDPKVRAILYENEATFIAAENYLRERRKDMPENRHFYPDCTSWVYGWRLTDYPPVPRSKVGRTALVMNEFYHPWLSSLRTDPEWYRPPQITQSVCRDNEY
ncbi:uncharacterized protein LOC143375933 [Andrena cerasifolii]|uniref:uncharacterized protein LOC143375933 n=1 Tax=Andrena cerasifolii TaxID=2819439 RepID=UPI004037D69B